MIGVAAFVLLAVYDTVVVVRQGGLLPPAPSPSPLPDACAPQATDRPAALPSLLFFTSVEGPLIDPGTAKRLVMEWWPIEEKALATDDRTTTDLIEAGPAAEYADAVTCADAILGVASIRTVRPLNSVTVYVSRQSNYPASFLAEVGTTVYGRSPVNAPDTALPPGTPFMEYLVFVKADPGSAWKVVIDTGYAGGTVPDAMTLERASPAGQVYEAAPPRPEWIDPRLVPQDLAAYWQHWVDSGGPPAGDEFAPGRWTTMQGAYLQQGHLTDTARGVTHHTRYFVDPSDGTYQFAVYDGVDLVCFVVRYGDQLTPRPGSLGLLQEAGRNNYGTLLAPGIYSSIDVHGLHQSCALIPPLPTRPLISWNGPGIGIIGGQGGDTKLTGSP